MKRILVATDFSDASREVVRYGLELTTAIEGDMLLLHVVDGDPIRTYAVGGVSDRFASSLELTGNLARVAVPPKLIHRDLCEEVRWKLSALLPAGSRGRIRALVTVGKAAVEIVRVAREQNTDLIVMGTHGRGSLRSLLRRSLAAKVNRKASLPVITVDATSGDLRLHSGGPGVPYRRSTNGCVSLNYVEVCGGSEKMDGAYVLATAHTKEA